jgi:ribonuclease Z
MTKLTILGTASAIPDESHYNTHMAIQSIQGVILIDCPGTTILRLKQSGIDPNDLTDLIVTHFHPDHTNGIPLASHASMALRSSDSAEHLWFGA